MNSLGELVPLVEKRLGKRLSPEQVLMALCIDRNRSVEDVASVSWNEESLAGELKECRSIIDLPPVIAIAQFDASIVPQGTEQDIYEERVRHKGELWFIHKHDADPFPSNPHAHNYESGLKLHLGNGNIYRRTALVGRLTQKVLLELREKVKHVELPPLENALQKD